MPVNRNFQLTGEKPSAKRFSPCSSCIPETQHLSLRLVTAYYLDISNAVGFMKIRETEILPSKLDEDAFAHIISAEV